MAGVIAVAGAAIVAELPHVLQLLHVLAAAQPHPSLCAKRPFSRLPNENWKCFAHGSHSLVEPHELQELQVLAGAEQVEQLGAGVEQDEQLEQPSSLWKRAFKRASRPTCESQPQSPLMVAVPQELQLLVASGAGAAAAGAAIAGAGVAGLTGTGSAPARNADETSNNAAFTRIILRWRRVLAGGRPLQLSWSGRQS